jgi:hypothetical protein
MEIYTIGIDLGVLRENLKNVAIYAVFRSLVKQGRRSRSSCGNVGTRVLCGFPGSEGIARTLASGHHHFALGASFPTAIPRYFKRVAKSGRRSAPNVHLSKSCAKCAFHQILVQTRSW